MIHIPFEELTLIKLLGKGGCGEVYLAESKTLGKIAVKKTQIERGEQIMIDFLNEAELLSKLNSPYIIRFFGTTKSQEGECIVMEYAENGTLYHFLQSQRRENFGKSFSWDKRYLIAQDISRGLLLMHSRKVLHRDLKSLNILLDENLRAKISDFGLSKVKTQSQAFSGLKVQNNVFGSLAYKAPETYSANNPYTDKADIFALGLIFWEIATCFVPYEGYDPSLIMSSVILGERLKIPSTCPMEFQKLIELCWSHNHNNRPTANIVFEKITQIISQRPIFEEKKVTIPAPQTSGQIPDREISFSNEQKPNFVGGDPDRYLTVKPLDERNSRTIDKKLEPEKVVKISDKKDMKFLERQDQQGIKAVDEQCNKIMEDIPPKNLENDIFKASTVGNLSIIMNMVKRGTNVNAKDTNC